MAEVADPSAQLLEAMFQHAPIGLAVFDRDLRVLKLNDRLAALSDIEVESTVGRPLKDVLPEVAEQVDPLVRQAFATGEAIEGVEIRRTIGGRRRHRIGSYFPIRQGGAVVAVGVVVEEATARREAEEALRASEARYRYLYQRTPAMMHSIDREGRLVDVSDAWLERLGYTRDEVIGRPSVDFLTPESRRYAEEVVLPAYFRTGIVDQAEYQLVRKDGEILDILLSAVAERDARGEFERSLAVLVDITERKKAQEALRRSEAQLLRAQKMEAIGRLAGGVAHDFNNLLVVILGYADLLLTRVTDPQLVGPVEHIARAGERAAALTRQILTFSRQQVTQPRVLDLNEVVRDVEKLLGRLIREDIALVVDLADALGPVRVDAGQAAQVLMNLAVNASDAMPLGGRLVIETTEATIGPDGPCEPGRYVLLTVTDTGEGMDAETQARIFEPFFTTKEPGRGTGLGLATVYGVVRQSGGCITVYSEPGRGSSFRVYLPRAEPGGEADEEQVVAPAPAPGGARTVLVVEDDDMVRTIVAEMLRESGYLPLVAPCAEDALRLVEAHGGRLDVVLTDVVMPGTGCAVLVERVQALHPEARVVFMSGHTAGLPPVDPRRFLQKPFTMNELLRKLQAVL